MPSRDRHGKSPKDYRDSLIAELEAISPRPRKRRGLSPLLLIWLLVPVVALWLNWPILKQHFTPEEIAATSPPPSPSSVVSHAPAVYEQPQQAIELQAPASTRPLEECMQGKKVIDEDVLRCRYGELPRSRPQVDEPRGMVSAAYLNQYKAEQAANSTRRTAASQSSNDAHTIPSWDGRTSYLATWSISGNRIDYGSVCTNYRKGSIEYRECRKGAKQWFKSQCEYYRQDSSVLRDRYCSAASGFSPMG